MKSRPNPYAKYLKREITIDTDISVIEYFKEMAQKSGLSYENLINLYLKDCINSNPELKMQSGSYKYYLVVRLGNIILICFSICRNNSTFSCFSLNCQSSIFVYYIQ